MASSAEDICSQALDLLGVPPISSFEDNRVAATCGRLFDTQMNSLFAAYPWNFTIKYVQLSRTSNTPVAQWQYEFLLPSDLVLPSVYAVFRTEAVGEPPLKLYEITNNRRLLANELEIYMQYSLRPPVADWPSHFYLLAIYAMAAILAMPVTEDQALADKWEQKAFGVPSDNGQGGYFAQAARRDAQQDPPRRLVEHTLIEARVGDGLPDFN